VPVNRQCDIQQTKRDKTKLLTNQCLKTYTITCQPILNHCFIRDVTNNCTINTVNSPVISANFIVIKELYFFQRTIALVEFYWNIHTCNFVLHKEVRYTVFLVQCVQPTIREQILIDRSFYQKHFYYRISF